LRENATVNLYENEEIRRRRHWALSREAPKGVAADGEKLSAARKHAARGRAAPQGRQEAK